MKIEKLLKKLDAEIMKKNDEYQKLHEELNLHRGKKLEETDLPTVNNILKKIQLAFHEIYPAYHFITYRYQSSNNSIIEYNNFIESIKQNGATQEPLDVIN
jgi:hypothetical protein